jgi:hypothetical protein
MAALLVGLAERAQSSFDEPGATDNERLSAT